MIEILQSEPHESGYKLFFTFKFFGNDTLFSENKIYESERQAMHQLYETKRQTFLHNFEKFFLECFMTGPQTEKQKTSLERLRAANTYFNETADLTLEKICSMTIGVQSHLMAALPAGKDKDYDLYFSWLNSLIKFSKEEVKSGSNT